MANTYSFLNIHCVFSTKERVPILTPEIRERLWPYLGGIARQNGFEAKCVGGVADHVHLLLSLPTTIAISKAIKLIKGGSSIWIHQMFPKLGNFSWQRGMGLLASEFLKCPKRSVILSSKRSIIGHARFKR